MNNYKYSVVIPCYNAEKFIKRAMQSVINQTYKNVELIVVNDGSTDNSEKEILRFKVDNIERDILYKKIENSGPSTARNEGIKMSSGDYVCFLDSDDEYMPELFERIDKKLNKEDICYFKYFDCNEEGKVISHYSDLYEGILIGSGVEIAKAKFESRMWICNCNAVYKKDLIVNYNNYYPEGIFSGEDTCFIYSNLLNAVEVTAIDYEGFKCYVRNNSLMHSKINDRFLTIVKAYEELLKRVNKNNRLIDVDKEYFINAIKSLQYFLNVSLAKKILYSTPNIKYKEYKNEIKKYKISYDINYSEVKGYYSKLDKLQIKVYNLSKLAFYYMTKLHMKRQ